MGIMLAYVCCWVKAIGGGFFETEFLCNNSSDCPGTPSVDQVDL